MNKRNIATSPCETKRLSNFGRGSPKKYSCIIISKSIFWFRRRSCLNVFLFFSIFSSGGHLVQQSGTVWTTWTCSNISFVTSNDTKIPKCASTDRGRWKKNSEQSANNQDRRDFCLSDNCVLSSLKETVIFFYFFLFLRSHFFASAFAQCIYGTAGRSLEKVISVHTLERLLMLWLLVITFDTLLIKLMQTAQLTFNGRTVIELFAVLFLFRGIPVSWKDPQPAELSAFGNLLGSFSIFLGALWCYNWAHSRYALYRAENIRDQLFVWNFFLY